MSNTYSFSSESVTEGHPDKVADAISDAVLDAVLAQDPEGKVACETLVTRDLVVLAGELNYQTSQTENASIEESWIDLEKIARKTIAEAGYLAELSEDAQTFEGFDRDSVAILNLTQAQSEEINRAVVKEDELGAGDQGIMFGYAERVRDREGVVLDTELMPLPIFLAHQLARTLAEVRKEGVVDQIFSDGKTQVTANFQGSVPVEIDKVLISIHNRSDNDRDELKEVLFNEVVLPTLPGALRIPLEKFILNPSGSFNQGGPGVDTGLTGRKIIVDTYGGWARHGGGAFSGKDPTKVDRSAAYAARYAAKNVVAAGLAERCEIQLGYAIGQTEPLSVRVETYGTTGTVFGELQVNHAVNEVFDFRPKAIIDHFDLRNILYRPTTNYGHFGRPGFPWERTDKVDELRQAVGLN